jgi:hypothetical protein
MNGSGKAGHFIGFQSPKTVGPRTSLAEAKACRIEMLMLQAKHPLHIAGDQVDLEIDL